MQQYKLNTGSLLGNIALNISNSVAIFLASFSSSLLGYSAYLFLEAFSFVDSKYSSWSGEALMWGFVLFFSSIFILFVPIELNLLGKVRNHDFQTAIGAIVTTVLISIFILSISSVFFSDQNLILSNVSVLLRAYAYSGLVFVNIGIFVLWWFSEKLKFIDRYSNTLVGIVWVLTSIVFI
tara:strand:+ start:334 stop:873 length:540 start_codon:yes stop_codon:yes gene_type:complete